MVRLAVSEPERVAEPPTANWLKAVPTNGPPNSICNAAFVVSTILIRLSLTEGYPFGAPLALMAMVFGILTLLVFFYHMRLNEPSTS